jgi:hypothetical protein
MKFTSLSLISFAADGAGSGSVSVLRAVCRVESSIFTDADVEVVVDDVVAAFAGVVVVPAADADTDGISVVVGVVCECDDSIDLIKSASVTSALPCKLVVRAANEKEKQTIINECIVGKGTS